MSTVRFHFREDHDEAYLELKRKHRMLDGGVGIEIKTPVVFRFLSWTIVSRP